MSTRRRTAESIGAGLVKAAGALAAGALLALAGAGPAFAGAWWHLSSRDAPTFIERGGKATIILTATDVGDTGVNATTTRVSIKDTLPPGLEATAIKGAPAYETNEKQNMTCELTSLRCTSQAEALPAFQSLQVTIEVNVKAGAASGEENQVSVNGGEQEHEPGVEVPGAALAAPITVEDQPTPFGVEADGYRLAPEQEGGALDTHAGTHPFQLTTTLELNQSTEPVPGLGLVPSAPALPKQLSFNLPPGLIGDPRAVAQCSDVDFLVLNVKATNACSPESAIGVAVVTLDEPSNYHFVTRAVPLWNLEPAQGEPARFGFEVYDVPIVLDTALRSGGDYGVSVTVNDATEAAQLLGSEVTIWGVPADPAHGQSQGWDCVDGGIWSNEAPCEPHTQPNPPAFLTLPTSCTGQLSTSVEGQSWPVKTLASEPGQILTLQGPATRYTLPGALEECQDLPFTPSITAEPTQEENGQPKRTHAASTAAGLDVDVHVPQQSTLQAGGLGEADVKATTVTLPAGVLLNPSSADGLQACSERQIGYEGAPGVDPFSPGAAQPLRFTSAPASCPDASKLGLVDIKTPLLESELHGSVYLATPAPLGEAGRNPFNALLALYILAEDPAAGIRVKLAGESTLNPETGQITTSFQDTPQVPFEELKLALTGGPRASISTPAHCGAYQTSASFTPWSGVPAVGVSAPAPAEEFAITTGAAGSGCQDPLALAPAMQGGSTNLQAGAFTDFALQITRPDGNQALQRIAVTLPPGNAAILASVTPCPEPQASLGTCGPESEIGQASASSGVGPDPYTITGGRVYITGPYQGAPFGLSIVTPAVAGPFNLGNVVVRSAININPSTAAVTITSTLPTFVQGIGRPATGIPLALRHIDVTVDRPGFEFNPTNCDPMSIQASFTGAEGQSAGASSPFQVAGCQNLPFHPELTAVASGHGSKANGTSLKVTVSSAGLGQANIAKVDLQLPKTLSSRLSTLQQACTETVFNVDPAACDEGSVIGNATIHTPVLRNPLSGPAYLVSHGGAAFPDVEFVLQGEGITLVLDGKTDIKNGITYSRFESAPDAPFTVFETVLPAGPHGVLTPNVPEREQYGLCKASLAMPTEITGQNGAVINETTNIVASGCGGVLSTKTKLTRAQLLAKALAACHKRYKHSKAKRRACERQARQRYAPKAVKKHTTKKK